ncbi:J domain-containing protein [Streptosporangium carneum]|uniref:Molecular chaperone DnaJ n=1 Tax=Streptosporangium carneum TaxID=47481 RepID=A0A9W6I0J7_9ACTN|nr:J domain-containing protein [Streptosporangium carneum]GLK09044.1 molecular chaperone DnaJ [Streptosporangium carneum]
MPPKRNFYEILGLPRNASQEDIQRAYRKLARANHPDVNKDPAAEDRFKDISEAYSVLSDPKTRRRYDAFGPDFRQVPEDVDPETWARAGAGRAGAGRAGAGRGQGGWTGQAGPSGFEGVDIDDLLEGLFSGRAGRTGAGGRAGPGWGPIPGADQEAEIELGVEDAYRGGRKAITVGGRRIEVDIPAGVTDGQRIRLAGQGGRGGDGAPAGDLYLIVRIARHPRYRVEGRDIHLRLPVTPWEGALGATVAVETPGGEAKVKVPPGTSSGRRLRLRGRGMPNPRGQPGDLFAEIRIMVPPRLGDEERRLFEQLAAVSTFDPRRQ